MLTKSRDASDEATTDAGLFENDVPVESPGVPSLEPPGAEAVSEPGGWLRQQQDQASRRSTELHFESTAVQAQSGQAIQRARRLRSQIARDRELALGLRWVAGLNGRDAEALVRIAGTAIKLLPGRLFGGQACYYGHAGLRNWIAEIASDPAVSQAFISVSDVRRERSGAILVAGELVVRGRSVTPLTTLLLVQDRAITTVRHLLGDDATLKPVGHVDP